MSLSEGVRVGPRDIHPTHSLALPTWTGRILRLSHTCVIGTTGQAGPIPIPPPRPADAPATRGAPGLARGAPLVLVDNSNARREQYAFYERCARREGRAVCVVEVACASDRQLHAFHRRCSHGVPLAAMCAMRAKWQSDVSAVLLHQPLGAADAPADEVPAQAVP